jgi:hypothetical protein
VIQYRPKKGHNEYFYVPVSDQLVSVSAGLVPGPALCPGAGAAERSQETLYSFIAKIFFFNHNLIYLTLF